MNVYARKTMVERAIGAGALVFALLAPQLVSGFWMDTVLTQTFILGIGAASLVFLSAFGGMISLAQAGLMGIAGYALGNMVTEGADGGETKGLLLGGTRRSPSWRRSCSRWGSGFCSVPWPPGASGSTS